MSVQRTPTALGTENIGKLLMQYAIPAIIAMTASSLYNMVDSIFIGQGVGPMAISGLALTFPLMNLAAAFGSLVGVGASTLVSVKLGQRDYDTARRVLGNVVVLNVILGFTFAAITLMFLDPILYFFGGSDQTVGYARDYMQIILLGNIITHMYLGLNAVLRSSGHPKQAMYATIATVIINTILDPIFIFWFDWGIRGAAIATVIAQLVSLIWLLKLFSNKEELLHFSKGIFRLKRKIVFNSLAIGLSPFLMNVASCLIVILINKGLNRYGGDYAVGAYGIVNRLVFMIVMVVMGLNQGMQPIAGYNYGAGHMDRLISVVKLTILFATLITTTGFAVGVFFPEPCVAVFAKDAPELVAEAAHGFSIAVLFFPFVGMQIVSTAFFQSIGMAGKSIFLSLTRQMLFLLPALFILPHFFERPTDGVWWSGPVSDAMASILSAVLLVQQFRKLRDRQTKVAE